MQRRRALLLTLSPLALAACGFQLRQAPKFDFASLQLDGSSSPVVVELRRSLVAAGMRLQTAPPPRPAGSTDPVPQGADVRLQVLQDQRERVVVGQTAAGQIRELQLRTRFRFRLGTSQGRELIPDTELLQTRESIVDCASFLSALMPMPLSWSVLSTMQAEMSLRCSQRALTLRK